MPTNVLIGTASWSDPEFVRDWYPKGLRPADRLFYYGQSFRHGGGELHLLFPFPSHARCSSGPRSTADDFVFDVKLHKLLSRHSCEAKMLPKSLQEHSSRPRIAAA